jgi:predicted NodU family carbamoyl transferase
VNHLTTVHLQSASATLYRYWSAATTYPATKGRTLQGVDTRPRLMVEQPLPTEHHLTHQQYAMYHADCTEATSIGSDGGGDDSRYSRHC